MQSFSALTLVDVVIATSVWSSLITSIFLYLQQQTFRRTFWYSLMGNIAAIMLPTLVALYFVKG